MAPHTARITNSVELGFDGEARKFMTDTSIYQKSPKYSFGFRPSRRAQDRSPGPGAYSAHVIGIVTPRAATTSFSHSPRLSYHHSSTSLCDYTPKQAFTKPKSARPVFGTSTRGKYTPDVVPGPGAYNQALLMGKSGPQYTAQGSKHERRTDMKPGPGAYDEGLASPTKKTSPAYSMGRTKKFFAGVKIEHSLPGPGAYSPIRKHVVEAPHYSLRQRAALRSSDSTPGPGAYRADLTQFGY